MCQVSSTLSFSTFPSFACGQDLATPSSSTRSTLTTGRCSSITEGWTRLQAPSHCVCGGTELKSKLSMSSARLTSTHGQDTYPSRSASRWRSRSSSPSSTAPTLSTSSPMTCSARARRRATSRALASSSPRSLASSSPSSSAPPFARSICEPPSRSPLTAPFASPSTPTSAWCVRMSAATPRPSPRGGGGTNAFPSRHRSTPTSPTRFSR
mmetsp:Transcript_12535/g.31505  ORF Transcript_12535/g.31505 Transcript_12535/m.31505 type:complete len:210 (-) Transcript_12535:879-1508(-)